MKAVINNNLFCVQSDTKCSKYRHIFQFRVVPLSFHYFSVQYWIMKNLFNGRPEVFHGGKIQYVCV